MDIFLFATWSKQIGSGHIKRLEALSYYFDDVKASRNVFLVLNARSSIPLAILPSPSTKVVGTSEGIELMRQSKDSSLAVFDLHESEFAEYLPWIKSLSISKYLICDYIPEPYLYSVFDAFFSGSVLTSTPLPVPFFNGLEYFIMPREYSHAYLSRLHALPQITKDRSVFLSLGGTDHNNITGLILSELLLLRDKYNLGNIDVYCSSLVRDSLITSSLTSSGRLSFITGCSSLATVWHKYLFAITSGGNTLFERICAGVPGLTINQLKRQDGFSAMFQDFGVNHNLGMWDCLTSYSLDQAMHSVTTINPPIIELTNMPLDAYGGCRVAKLVLDKATQWLNHS